MAENPIRNLLRESPYFLISLSMTATLLALTTVWKIGESRRAAGTLEQRTTLREVDEPKAAEPPVERKQIFEAEDVPTETSDIDFDPSEIEPRLPDDPDAIISDRQTTANDEDHGMVKGTGLDQGLTTTGESLFDVVGVGGNSGRGGRGGIGGPWGDRVNRRLPHGDRGRKPTPERAADSGLRWLARHQDADGSWSPEAFHALCGANACAGAGYPEHRVGTTGLALLAFLGAGYTNFSPHVWTDPLSGKKLRAGDILRNGLRWLRAQQDESGSFTSGANSKWGYGHSIATLAMAEAYGLSHALQWKESAQKAVDALVLGQSTAPGSTGLLGWRYRPQSGESDISVTGWAVMALKSAQLAQLRVPQGSLEGAFEFCDEVTDKTTGQVGYLRREDAGQQVKAPGKNDDYLNHPALAAVGMCVRTFAHHDVSDPMLEAGAKLLVRDLPAWSKAKKSNDFYYWYYGSLALNQLDGPESPRPRRGEYWNPWNDALKKALVDNQVSDAKACTDGSWDADDRWGFEGGRVYATAINTLTLEVYYRYANVFGRSLKK